MTYQTAANVKIAFKAQSGLGVPASGAGATGLKVNPTQGMALNKAIIANPTIRFDGQTSLGRHGSRNAGLSYKLPLSVGTLDELIQAVLRGTTTATFDITNATTLGGSAAATSITTTANTIVAAAGSWLLQGLRKGMMIKLTGHSTPGNNGIWIPVVDVSALTITTPAAALILNATPDTTFTVSVAKNCLNGATPLERYFTVEEYMQDSDVSELGTDMKISKIEINCQPNANIEVTVTFMGLDDTPQTSGASPIFTSPTYTTTLPLVMADGIIRIAGVAEGPSLTGFSLVWDLGGDVPATLSQTSPDVFLGNGKISGSFTVLRRDLSYFTAFRNETIVDFFIVCSENEADPKDFCSFYVGRATYSGNSKSFAATGPMSETIPWNGGIDETGGAAASTSVLFSTSAA